MTVVAVIVGIAVWLLAIGSILVGVANAVLVLGGRVALGHFSRERSIIAVAFLFCGAALLSLIVRLD